MAELKPLIAKVAAGTPLTRAEARENAANDSDEENASPMTEPGWFWQACFPGCLPDSEPNGPFATRAEALADARSTYED